MKKVKITNVKMDVTHAQFKLVEDIIFSRGNCWNLKTKYCNIVYIDDKNNINWCNEEVLSNRSIETVDVFDWLKANNSIDKEYYLELCNTKGEYLSIRTGDELTELEFNVIIELLETKNWNLLIKKQLTSTFIKLELPCYYTTKFQHNNSTIKFDTLTSGEVVWVDEDNEYDTVGEFKTGLCKCTDGNVWEKVNYSKSTENKIEINKGDRVIATRKGDSLDIGYVWEGTYYGKFNDHYLLDFNGYTYQIADKIEIVPKLTKKEANQKISELFSNNKNITAEKVMNIIDQIADKSES